MYVFTFSIVFGLISTSRIVNSANTIATPVLNSTSSYSNWTTQEQRDQDYAEMLMYRDTMALGHVHANGDNRMTSPDEENRERLSTMDDIWQEMCTTTDATELVTLGEQMHSKVSKGWCGLCIQRRGYDDRVDAALPDITLNFKDIKGESNWNVVYLTGSLSQDCTEEKISHGRQLKMVQVYGQKEYDHCICNLHISCSTEIAKFSNAWINLSGAFLVNHFKLHYPNNDPSLQGKCPHNCVMFGPFYDGLVGMNVYREALNCPPNDDACKHAHIEMW